MYYKIVNDRKVFSQCKSIQLEYNHPPLIAGQWVSNPSEELILSDGWEIYVPPVVPSSPQTEPGYEEVVSAVKKMLSHNVEELSDEEALEVAALYPTWSSKIGEEVSIGERLWYDGALYKVIQAHTAQETWTPDVTAPLFAKVSIEEIPEWVQPISAETTYKLGDKVKHNGLVWESLVDYNSWEPGAVGTENLWRLIS